jgi:hypothetical protein
MFLPARADMVAELSVQRLVVGWFDRPKKQRRKPLSGQLELADDSAPLRPLSLAQPSHAPRMAKGGSWFPGFRATASDQPRPTGDDRFATARLGLRAAFTPSQPVIDRMMFAGRTQVLTTLIRSIEDERLHTIVYGERGIGKTSLTHVLAQAAREARYLVSYVSCGAASNFDDTFRAVAGDVPLLYHSAYGPSTPEAERGDTVADLLPQGPISVRQAGDYLAGLVGTRVLIVLDEFDRVESAAFRLNIAEFLKNLSDRSARVQLLIAGVAANLTELLEHVPSIQRNILPLQIPRMSEAEVRQLVKIGEENSELQFEEAARRFIVAAANGLPYLASLLSHHAGLEAIEKSRLDVTAADVAAAVARALNEQEGRISKRSQAQINSLIQDGAGVALGGLSNLAQSNGGELNVRDLGPAFPSSAGTARTENLVRKLAAEGVLLERQESELGATTYHFAEESVPIYLWLLATQARFGVEEDPLAPPERDRVASL